MNDTMTYSHGTKMEICRLPFERDCCAVAECYGMLLFGNTFSRREIKIITSMSILGKRISNLFTRAFGFTFDILPDEAEPGKQAYIISDREKIGKVFETFGLSKDNMPALYLNLGALDDDCCRIAFIRGAFFTGGAVTDPEKSYHLELVTAHYNVGRQTYSLLLDLEFSPKEASRSGHYIIYFKQSAAIEDFLTLIGAPVHAMKLMSAKIEKDVRNSVNRKVNCDTANVAKTVDAAYAQIEAIKKIKAAGQYEKLSDKLRQAAELRVDNPELTIKELADISLPPVTKSCMNHRMRKIAEIAKMC